MLKINRNLFFLAVRVALVASILANIASVAFGILGDAHEGKAEPVVLMHAKNI